MMIRNGLVWIGLGWTRWNHDVPAALAQAGGVYFTKIVLHYEDELELKERKTFLYRRDLSWIDEVATLFELNDFYSDFLFFHFSPAGLSSCF